MLTYINVDRFLGLGGALGPSETFARFAEHLSSLICMAISNGLIWSSLVVIVRYSFGIYGIEEGLRINRSHSTFLSFAEILKKLESAFFGFIFIFKLLGKLQIKYTCG